MGGATGTSARERVMAGGGLELGALCRRAQAHERESLAFFRSSTASELAKTLEPSAQAPRA
jgi:hypothetical protein